MTEKSKRNRRRFERYSLKSSVFLTFRPRFDTLGMVVDVSKGGVAFEYTASGRHRESAASTIEVEIFSHESFRLSRIPCKIVYDTRAEGGPTMPGFETRRCGLQFGGLSDTQSSQLKVLMDTHAGRHLPAV